MDITTVEDRLRGKNTIVHEFTGKVSGWCRERFIPVDYDDDGGFGMYFTAWRILTRKNGVKTDSCIWLRQIS